MACYISVISFNSQIRSRNHTKDNVAKWDEKCDGLGC